MVKQRTPLRAHVASHRVHVDGLYSRAAAYQPPAGTATHLDQLLADVHLVVRLAERLRHALDAHATTSINRQLAVKVIRRKAASPPHADDSIVFARLRQCAPHLVHSNRHLYRTSSAPSRLEYINCQTCLGMSWAGPLHFTPSKLPLCARGSGAPSNTGFLGPT